VSPFTASLAENCLIIEPELTDRLVRLVPMLRRGNAYSVAPAASTRNYFKFLSIDAVQITGSSFSRFSRFLVPMLQRGNADSVAPAASTRNYFKFLSIDAVQITDFLWIKHLPRERPGRHYHAGAWEREKRENEKDNCLIIEPKLTHSF
jgi:hypothetical protein